MTIGDDRLPGLPTVPRFCTSGANATVPETDPAESECVRHGRVGRGDVAARTRSYRGPVGTAADGAQDGYADHWVSSEEPGCGLLVVGRWPWLDEWIPYSLGEPRSRSVNGGRRGG